MKICRSLDFFGMITMVDNYEVESTRKINLAYRKFVQLMPHNLYIVRIHSISPLLN